MPNKKRLSGEESKAARREYQRQYAANYRENHPPKDRSDYFKEWEKRRSAESKAKKAKRDAIRYQKKKKEMAERNSKWFSENKERRDKWATEHRKNNYAACRAREIRYSKSERGRIMQAAYKRRWLAIKRSRICEVTNEQIEVLRASQRTCHYCGIDPSPARLTIDHFLPVAKGGIDAIENFVMACKSCNSRKSAMLPDVWAKRSGFSFGQPPFSACR